MTRKQQQQDKVVRLCREINDLGGTAFYYPRLRQVSISGGRRMDYEKAIPELEANLAYLKRWIEQRLKTTLDKTTLKRG